MLDSKEILRHLPSLRRYARALTGSQASGDAHVAATLEVAVADGSALEDAAEPRVAIYRLFSRIRNSLSINGMERIVEPVEPAERKLANITPLPRQVFLLTALEGFDESEAAQILDVDVATLRSLAEECGRELAAQIATDVLIIEDEALIA